jgi:hypothetical protein
LQAANDFPQGSRLGELTEEHRHQLLPAREAFGAFLGRGFPHASPEEMAVDHAKKLAKQAAML